MTSALVVSVGMMAVTVGIRHVVYRDGSIFGVAKDDIPVQMFVLEFRGIGSNDVNLVYITE
jgi:hypothetical protein